MGTDAREHEGDPTAVPATFQVTDESNIIDGTHAVVDTRKSDLVIMPPLQSIDAEAAVGTQSPDGVGHPGTTAENSVFPGIRHHQQHNLTRWTKFIEALDNEISYQKAC